ncbi:hypothetical protein IWW45_009154, partial [Coemansia sp. RSA 485]
MGALSGRIQGAWLRIPLYELASKQSGKRRIINLPPLASSSDCARLCLLLTFCCRALRHTLQSAPLLPGPASLACLLLRAPAAMPGLS